MKLAAFERGVGKAQAADVGTAKVAVDKVRAKAGAETKSRVLNRATHLGPKERALGQRRAIEKDIVGFGVVENGLFEGCAFPARAIQVGSAQVALFDVSVRECSAD